MELTKIETKKLKELSEEYPEVKKMVEFMQLYLDDPTKEYYRELLETIKYLSKELRAIRNGDMSMAPIMTGDDKIFERTMLMLNNSEKIFNSLEKGKSKEEKGVSETQEYII